MQQTVILTLLDLISLKGIFSFGYVLFVLITIGVIIHDKRDPVKALSWIVVLILLPVAGFLLYIVFGRNHRKEKLFNRKELHDLEQIDEMSREQVYAINNAALLLRSEITENRDIITLLLNSNKALLTNHNRIRVLNNGTVTFDEIKAALRGARSSIHLEYYIIEDDPLGREIAEILIGKAREGVEVRLIYDDVGSWGLSRRYIRHLRNAGVEVQCFMRVVFPWLTSKVNYRNHRKILVVDGHIGFTGGINIADEYTNEIELHGHWKDTGVMVRGRAAQNFSAMFLQLWEMKNAEDGINEEDFERYISKSPEGKYACLPFADSPFTGGHNICESLYLKTIYNAKKYVYINTPYLILDDEMKKALITAAHSGVDVRITVPFIPDKKYVYAVTKAFYTPLIKEGIRIYRYTPGFIHAKSIVSDGNVCIIGSSNMDFRSFYLHCECNIMFFDKEVADDLYHDYLQTCAVSELMTEKSSKTSLFRKIYRSVLRFFAPLM